MLRRGLVQIRAVAFCVLAVCPTPSGAATMGEGAVNPTAAFVRVEAYGWSRQTGSGNAVAFGPDRLLTACHVLAGAESIRVIRDGKVWQTQLVEAVPSADLCLLDRPQDLETQPILMMDPPADGPLSAVTFWPDRPGPSLARGEVSGLATVRDQSLILTDIPMLPGMSGGGVFNAQGALVGIAVGRWHAPVFGIAVGLAPLRHRQPMTDPAALSPLPDFLDEQKTWAEMLLVGLARSFDTAATRSGVFDGWHVSRQQGGCFATLRDAEQADLGVTLEVYAGNPVQKSPPRVHLAVEQQGVPFALASQPLSFTVLPSLHAFSLRPARLLQGREGVAENLWSVRWELDDATDFLRALPGVDGVILSSGSRDLGALPVSSPGLWSGLRQTCL